MKQRNIAYLVFVALGLPVLIWACPFTFKNTGSRSLIVADEYENAYQLPPGEETTIRAPMKDEILAGFQHDVEVKNGHARMNIYEESETAGRFTNKYQLIEAECGKKSVVESEKLAAMAAAGRSGRFIVTDLTKNPLVKKKELSNE